MTITPTADIANFIVSNTKSLEKADVILLLEDHSSREDFVKIEKTLTRYYNHSTDLVLLEHPKTADRDHLLNQEAKLGPWRIKVLQDKNIAGWDHPQSEKWAKEFFQNPDVIDFTEAVKTLEHLSIFDDTKNVYRSFATLVRGFRHLEKDPTLIPLSEYKSYIEEKQYSDKTFLKIKDKLLNSGKKVIKGLTGAYIAQTFPYRQDSLLQTLKLTVPAIKANSGKVFVIMGSNHGNPFESTFPSEVQKVINFLADRHLFISF